MDSLVTFLRRYCVVASIVALAGCSGSSGAGAVPSTVPSPSPSFTGTTTQSVPVNGMMSFPIAANLGLQGTISFPLVPGAGGTGTLLYSTTTLAGLPDLVGPPLAPQLVEYLCVSFSVHQIALSAPALALSTSPAPGVVPSGIGLAYFQVPSNSWNQSYGVTAFAPSVTLVARDAVFYRLDRTCFALYLTAVTPLPS